MNPLFLNLNLPEHPLAYHVPLDAPDNPNPLPVSVYSEMIRQFEAGQAHEGTAYPKRQELAEAFEPVAASLLYGAFLSGHASREFDGRTGRFPKIEQVYESCAGIKRLVSAFLATRERDRERAFVAAKTSGHHMLEASIVGALCEARAASVILEAGIIVLDSTTDEDVKLGIDMIALADSDAGWLVQSKSDRESSGMELIAIDRDATTEKAWMKSEDFNRAYGVSFVPISARVGTAAGGLFRQRDPEDVEAARQFFQRLRDPA